MAEGGKANSDSRACPHIGSGSHPAIGHIVDEVRSLDHMLLEVE